MIEISDTGIGMSDEGLVKLFQPFSQADKSIQTRFGGTGLGLWITNKLINLMRGSVRAISEVNQGSTFIIEIPVKA